MSKTQKGLWGMMISGVLLVTVTATSLHPATSTAAPTSPSVTQTTITTAEAATTTTLPSLLANKQEVFLEVPYISQQDHPTGCESISAVMLLQYWGIDITADEFIDGYLECGETRWEKGELIGPSPNNKFVGNPRDSSGYGCYAPVIEKALRRAAKSFTAQNLTGGELSAIATQYLSQGTPVLIWATIEMENAYPTDEWINEADGSTVQWMANEHCMVLVGYDNDVYYCNDPYNNNGVRAYDRTLLEDRFEQMGQQALVILPEE